MSINHIKLNGPQLSGWYRQSLVLTGENRNAGPASTPSSPPVVTRYLGNFSRKILFLVNYKDEAHLPPEQLGFLTNILQACKLSMEDVAILNIARNIGVSYETITTELKPSSCIWLGVTASGLKAPFVPEEFLVESKNGIFIIAAPPLEAMNQAGDAAKILKLRLWNCLKQLFNI